MNYVVAAKKISNKVGEIKYFLNNIGKVNLKSIVWDYFF
ncbi:hypothetical protein BH11BAC5_BH11BAC5_25570 [soil metagenome]